MLCTRLREVLPELVNVNQGAFVEGRSILHNVLLAQELIKGYDQSRISPRCVLKIDLQKAYDSLSLEFLIELLEALRFPSVFVGWLRECICTVTYAVKINGENKGRIEGQRGLGQGDPLSPLLFVLAMEYLTRLLKKAAGTREFQYHPGCKKEQIINLCFADDLLIFCKATPVTVQSVLSAFNEFSKISCMVANRSKSRIYMGGISDQVKNRLVTQTGRIWVRDVPYEIFRRASIC